MEPTILIEKTAKRWKRLELLTMGLLFPALFAGVCFAGFCAVKIMAWYYHG